MFFCIKIKLYSLGKLKVKSVLNYRFPIKVFDFFSGCGGASKGFKNAGLEIVFALDNDADAGKTFQENFPEAYFVSEYVERFHIEKLQPLIESCKGHPILFSGCAPRADKNVLGMTTVFCKQIARKEIDVSFAFLAWLRFDPQEVFNRHMLRLAL